MVISARNQADVSPSVIMSRVEVASGAKYSIHKEPARKFEPIGPVGTSYTPVGKVDIHALRNEAAVKPPQPPRPTATRPPGVGQQWSKPVTSGFQPKYTAPPPVKSTPAPDDDWEPAPAPVKLTPAPPLPTATRPTPPAPAVSITTSFPHYNAHINSSHSLSKKSLSRSSLLPKLLRKIVSGLWEQIGNQSNFPSLRNLSTRLRNAHKMHYRNSSSKPSHQSRGLV